MIAHQSFRGRQLAFFVKLWIAAPVQSHHRFDPPALEIEAEEAAVFDAAAHHETVPVSRVSNIFQGVLILVRPEGVEVGIRLHIAEHGPSHSSPLAFSVVVMLDAHPARSMTTGRTRAMGEITGVDSLSTSRRN